MRYRLVIAAVGGALATWITPPTAMAAPMPWPENCDDGPILEHGWRAHCRSGAGAYKAVVQCAPIGGGPLIDHEPRVWSSIGTTSFAFCPPETLRIGGGILMKASEYMGP
jgi:hypothetical protein